jgi:hypothetical protein
LFLIEKAALSGKFDKEDPTIKDDFWLAKELWYECSQISNEIDDPKLRGTYGQFRKILETHDKVQGLLSSIKVAYVVGLTKIRDK